MELVIHYNHLDRSNALDLLIQNKCEKLMTKFRGEGSLTWNCSKEHDENISHVKLNLRGRIFNATSKSNDLYKTIESTLDKIEKQVIKRNQS